MDDSLQGFPVVCPWCGETVEVFFEPDVAGELVVDCEVCCRPWSVTLGRDRDGDRSIRVERAD
ncbi:MAG: CPXCG motif-containing cysteine-rich protein [Thermoanaerobaculia bacterium]